MGDGRGTMDEVRLAGLELEHEPLMSKYNNVNPGQYKVGGRLHPGDDSTEQNEAKARASEAEHELREDSKRPNEQDKNQSGGRRSAG